ncbi:MAG TPA: HEAT repeat domain-containing protein, partial [Sphingomicrobium sp.]
QDDGLYVAGKNIVRKYSLSTGRLLAEQEIGDSFGRGCLTNNEVLIPVKETIQRFDLNLNQPRSIAVSLMGHEPVGNLFSDGQRLWAVGAGRVYALTTLETRLKQLAELIAAGDGQDQLARMRLNLNQNRVDLALADLRGAYQLLAKQHSASEAAQAVFSAIWDQKLAQAEPVATLTLLTDLSNAGATPSALSPEARQRQHDLLTAAFSSIRQRQPSGATPSLLHAAELFDEDYLLTAATLAVDSAATPNNIPALLKALDNGPPQAKVISLRSAARLSPAEAKPRLSKLLGDLDNRVQLAAAKTLVAFNERTGVLETLLKLLESPSVEIRTRSQHTLQSLTGQHIPFAAEGSSADRAASIRAWRQWIDSQGASAILARPLTDRSTPLGRILVVSPSVLVELDANRQERRRISLPGSAWGCQGLPNGNRLVAINSHAMVIEYDDAGREVWRKDRLPAPPTSVQRLDSGSTLIACGNTQQVVEVAPDGSTTTIDVPGHPISAQRLESGNTLVALQDGQRVVEVNSRGRVLSEINTGSPPVHAVRLEN